MKSFIAWLVRPLIWLLDGSFDSGAASCAYRRRLAAVRVAGRDSHHRAA